ncbi:MAG: CRISPR-associated protein Csx3 [Methanothrix sp.]
MALYDPRLGAVVVASHSRKWAVRQVVDSYPVRYGKISLGLINSILIIYIYNYWIHIKIHRWEIALSISFYDFKSVLFIKLDGFSLCVYCNIPASYYP